MQQNHRELASHQQGLGYIPAMRNRTKYNQKKSGSTQAQHIPSCQENTELTRQAVSIPQERRSCKLGSRLCSGDLVPVPGFLPMHTPCRAKSSLTHSDKIRQLMT